MRPVNCLLRCIKLNCLCLTTYIYNTFGLFAASGCSVSVISPNNFLSTRFTTDVLIISIIGILLGMVLHVFRISSTTFRIPIVLGVYAYISMSIYTIALAMFVYGSNSSIFFFFLLPLCLHLPLSPSILRVYIRSFLIEIVLPAHFNFLLNTAVLKIVCWFSICLLFSIFRDWFGLIHSWNSAHFTLWFLVFLFNWNMENSNSIAMPLKISFPFRRVSIEKHGLKHFARSMQCVKMK